MTVEHNRLRDSGSFGNGFLRSRYEDNSPESGDTLRICHDSLHDSGTDTK